VNNPNHNLLLLSSSRAGSEAYLEHAAALFEQHFDTQSLQGKNIVFIPYAGVTISFDQYTETVQNALNSLDIKGIHQFNDAREAVSKADIIMVGGGNTFRLLYSLYGNERVDQGMPYVGWSAGSNISGQSIRTTNDMPIIEPPSFKSLGLLNCQLNPHYTDYQPPGHNGETRDQRLSEFTKLNPTTPVIAIREGTALSKKGDTTKLIGALDGFVFLGDQKIPIKPGQDVSNFVNC
jgi:dipeptidase E